MTTLMGGWNTVSVVSTPRLMQWWWMFSLPPQSPKVSEGTDGISNILKDGKVFFWILFQFSLRVVNDMGNCVPHACHSLHPIDWELSTQERAVGRVTVYLRWWLQLINFDGCHFIEKTMGVGTMVPRLVFCHQHVYTKSWRAARRRKLQQYRPCKIDFWIRTRPLHLCR